VGTRAGLEEVEKRKKSHHCPWRESNPGRTTRSLVSILTVLKGKQVKDDPVLN